MNNTADRILEVTQELIQTQGYNAISFNHIAERVGIRKPSIVHHFPNKGALGSAVVKRYRHQMASLAEQFFASGPKTAAEAFDFYCVPFLEFANSASKICLCGALAGEFLALPKEVQEQVTQFFDDHQQLLTQVMAQGQQAGEIQRNDPPAVLAQLVISALQGALISQRASGNQAQVSNVAAALRQSLFQ